MDVFLRRYPRIVRQVSVACLAFLTELILGTLFYLLMFSGAGPALVEAFSWVHIALGTLIVYISAKWYFKDQSIEGSAIEGLYFGAVMVLIRVLGLLFLYGVLQISVISSATTSLSSVFSLLTSPTELLAISLFPFICYIVGWEEARHRNFHAHKGPSE